MTDELKDKHCCETVYAPGSIWWHGHRCTKKVVICVNGKYYCKQHSPESVEKRRLASEARFNRENLRSNFVWARDIVGSLLVDHYLQGGRGVTQEIENKIAEAIKIRKEMEKP